MRFLVDRHRLEAIIAGGAVPKEGRTARIAFDPVGPWDRRSALGTGIFTRQIAGIQSGHGASPSRMIYFGFELDSLAAGTERTV